MLFRSSKKARVITRFVMSKVWQPVGSGINSDDEVTHVMTHLFRGPDGRKIIRDLDTKISALPGLEGLQIVERAMDNRGVPA